MEDFDSRIIILILFVVISGVKWFLEKVKTQGRQHDVSDSLEEIYDEFREEIRQRQTSIQPPAPAPSPPPLPNAQIPPPRQAEPPASSSYQPTPAPQQFKAKKPELTAAQKEAVERFQQLGRKKRRSKKPGQISARALLSTPQSARQAVILHEVFGKPKSMQSI